VRLPDFSIIGFTAAHQELAQLQAVHIQVPYLEGFWAYLLSKGLTGPVNHSQLAENS
jgi:hypothetical protein